MEWLVLGLFCGGLILCLLFALWPPEGLPLG